MLGPLTFLMTLLLSRVDSMRLGVIPLIVRRRRSPISVALRFRTWESRALCCMAMARTPF